MKKRSVLVLVIGASLLFYVGCASSNHGTHPSRSDSNTQVFDAGLDIVVNLAAKAIKTEGLGIDNHYSTDSGYVITAHINNGYLLNSPHSGTDYNLQESKVKVTAIYINDVKTKLQIETPEVSPGVSYTYKKNIKSLIFHYIHQHI